MLHYTRHAAHSGHIFEPKITNRLKQRVIADWQSWSIQTTNNNRNILRPVAVHLVGNTRANRLMRRVTITVWWWIVLYCNWCHVLLCNARSVWRMHEASERESTQNRWFTPATPQPNLHYHRCDAAVDWAQGERLAKPHQSLFDINAFTSYIHCATINRYGADNNLIGHFVRWAMKLNKYMNPSWIVGRMVRARNCRDKARNKCVAQRTINQCSSAQMHICVARVRHRRIR